MNSSEAEMFGSIILANLPYILGYFYKDLCKENTSYVCVKLATMVVSRLPDTRHLVMRTLPAYQD